MQTLSTRDIVRISWPLMVEQLFLVLIGVVNTMMSSNISEAAVSAVSYIDALNQLITAAFTAIATGATVVIAQYIGRDDPDKAGRAAGQAVLAVTGISCAVALLMVLFSGLITGSLLGAAEDAVRDNARIYLVSSALSLPFFGIYTTTAGILRGYGKTSSSMRVSVLMNVVNAAVGGLLIYGLHFDVLGVGLALVCARLAGAGFSLLTLMRGGEAYTMKKLPRSVDFAMLRIIMSVGIPVAVELVLFYAGRFLAQIYVVLMGTMYMSVYAVANSIIGIIAMPGQALSLAAVTVVGRCMGAGSVGEAKRHLLRIMYASMGFLMAELLLLKGLGLMNPLIGLYGPSGEAFAGISEFLTIYLFSAAVLWPPSFILPNGFKGAGDVRFTTVVALVSMFVVRITAGYVMGITFRMMTAGVVIAMCLDWVVRTAVFLFRYFQGGWLKHKVV